MIEVVTFETQDEKEVHVDARVSKRLTDTEAKLAKKWGVPARLVQVRLINDSRPGNVHARTPEVKRFVIESFWQLEAVS